MIDHPFKFGEKVFADGDVSVPMVVTGFVYRPQGVIEVECAYWSNGDHKSVLLPTWRVNGKEP